MRVERRLRGRSRFRARRRRRRGWRPGDGWRRNGRSRRWRLRRLQPQLLASENLIYTFGYPWTTNADPFITDYLGAFGGEAIADAPFVLSGVIGQPSAGQTLNLALDTPLSSDVGVINVRPGTEPLFTVPAKIASPNIRDLPCATVRRNVGDAGTSTFVHAGFPILNIVDRDAGTRAGAFQTLRAAAGIP